MTRGFFVSVLEIIEIAFITVGTVVLIRFFLVQPFLVSGDSMKPNFANGNYLLIDEITYRFRSPQRGEVVVFKYPSNAGTYFIKRIIGLPGERVQVKDGRVTVSSDAHPDGIVLTEDYLPPGTATSGGADATLGECEYFVLGDNRAFSFDSRSWGVLGCDNIVGVARLRLWPPYDIGSFGVPRYSTL
jgi:signal peptidase I